MSPLSHLVGCGVLIFQMLKLLLNGVKICSPEHLFLVDWFLTYGQLSNFQHWMGGG